MHHPTKQQRFTQSRVTKHMSDYELGRQACINGDKDEDGMSPSWYEGYAEQHAQEQIMDARTNEGD